MMRSVLLIAGLCAVLAGCGTSGGSGSGPNGLLSPTGNPTLSIALGGPSTGVHSNRSGPIKPSDAVSALKRMHVQDVISGGPGSPLMKGVRLPDGGGISVAWVVAGGYGSGSGDAGSPAVGTVQLFGVSSDGDARTYAYLHPPELEPDIHGGTFFGSDRNVIVKVGGAPARVARIELERVYRALARVGGEPPAH